MKRSKTFFKWAIGFQFLTAILHSVSFISSPRAQSPTEQQMFDLMQIPMKMGAGFTPSMYNIFNAMSTSLSILYLFAGMINIYLLRRKIDQTTLKGVLGINVVIFGTSFFIMLFRTFLPPVILTGIVFVLLLLAFVFYKKDKKLV